MPAPAFEALGHKTTPCVAASALGTDTPKNLAMALTGEAGKLLGLLQWLTDDEITTQLKEPDYRTAFEDKIAAALIYLLRLADITARI